ncbi:hypothetical protein [Plesiomonas shigelloides]|uniref:hypothetical protein n=1 Tax=Plesiomonas shigelloides TaxID=703 RepID=UPI00387F0374
MTGVFLSKDDLLQLSVSARNEVISLILGKKREIEDEINEDGPTDLSSIQAERLVHGLSEKTRLALKYIIESKDGDNGFWCKDLAQNMGIDTDELKGVWSGLTRRIRTVTNDQEAYLLAWAWDDEREDYYGSLDKVTYRNCKKAMNL